MAGRKRTAPHQSAQRGDSAAAETSGDEKILFTIRPPGRVLVAVKQLVREDEILTERAMGA